MTTSDSRPERFYSLILDYISQLEGTGDYVQALRAVDASAPVPPPVEDPPGAYNTAANWTARCSPKGAALVGAMCAEMHELPWHPPYAPGVDAGPGFAELAASSGRVGPKAPVRSDRVAAGFFAIGQGVDYFDHAHEPAELYIPIAGEAEFWAEGKGWRRLGPDSVMVHPPWQWHAMRTPDSPVLVLWMWLGPQGFGVAPTLRREIAGLPVDAPGA